jgi:exopolysaccharide production protein ExoZ
VFDHASAMAGEPKYFGRRPLAAVLGGGGVGVDVFFVISGFIIWTQAMRQDATASGFLWRRLTRVAPAYWLVTLAVAAAAALSPRLLPRVSLSTTHLALSLGFIPHYDPAGRMFPVLAPGWTLTYEAGFYLLVGASLLAPAKARLALVLGVLAVCALIGFIFTPLYELDFNPMLLQFAAGVWLARREARSQRLPPGAGVVFAALGLAAIAALWLAGVNDILFRPLLWGLPAVMIVAGALAIEPVRALAPPRALVRLGDASYALYLCHLPVITLLAAAIGAKPAWLFTPLAIAAAVVAGLAFHRWVETPLIAGARALPARLARLRPRPRPVLDCS